MARPALNSQNAFSLMEIIAALGIVAVIFIFINQATRFFAGQGDVTTTRLRMEEIVEKAKEYYRNHENLPILTGSPVDFVSVPIASASTDGFDIDPKYRLDRWGRTIQYISYANDDQEERPGAIQIDPLESPELGNYMVEIQANTRTLIRAIEYEGRRVAGIIISSGPNQELELDKVDPASGSGDPVRYVRRANGDDIIMPIDLNSEATQIALAELANLNDKVSAFNDRYLGVDNRGSDDPPIYDEAGCQGIRYPVDGSITIPPIFNNCDDLISNSPAGAVPPNTDRDINCCEPTLDYMKANFCAEPWLDCDLPLPAGSGGYYQPGRNGIDTVAPDPVCHRDPIDRSYASLGGCDWGLVQTQYGSAGSLSPNETDGDQARAFIFCLFELSPDAIVDPWLNGYVWGCGPETPRNVLGYTYNPCLYNYPVGDPHYHRFFSAGPDGLPAQLEAEIETTAEDQAATDDIIN